MKVETQDAVINTRIDGSEGAPWIVLSNSLGSNLAMWDPQIELLTQKYRVLRYDKRGHGGSNAPTGPYDFDMLAGDVIALMDHFSIERADWMGISIGAMTGIGLALKHVDRMGRLVLSSGRADTPTVNQANWDARIATVRERGLEAVADAAMVMWLNEPWRTANPDAVDGYRKMVLGNDVEGYVACCQAIKSMNYLPRLGEISNPVLYVVGSGDMGAPPDAVRGMADATPGAEFVEIEGGAHIPNIDSTDAFNAAIGRFLGIS